MKKVGHSGTLDPMATGVLIVGCGPSTRLLDYIQAGVKEYVAHVVFGTKTSSGDVQGELVGTCDMDSLTREELDLAVNKFIGTISQIPPMVSAVKVEGRKLYEYEREGIVVEREPRETVIDSIEVEEFVPALEGAAPHARIRVTCHAGTYIRTLAEDIAAALGGYAHLDELRRTRNGHVSQDQCVSLEYMKALDDPFSAMIAPAQALSHLASVELDDPQTLAVSHGKTLLLDADQQKAFDESTSEFVIVVGSVPRELIAVYPQDTSGEFRSRCVVFLDDL